MGVGQVEDARGGLGLRRVGGRHFREAPVVQFAQIDLAFRPQIEGQRDVIEARVPLHARGDGQGRRMVRRAPQNRRVKGAFVQIVEGGVGRRRRHHLGSASRKGVRQGDEPVIRGAGDQDANRAWIGHAGVQGRAVLREGRLPQAELLLGDGGANQLFDAQGGLGRMRRFGHRQIKRPGNEARRHRADGDDGQTPGAGRESQGLGKGVDLRVTGIEDRRFQLEVRQRGHRAGARTGRHRAPAQRVQPAAQGADPLIRLGDDQNAWIRTQNRRLPLRDRTAATPRTEQADHTDAAPCGATVVMRAAGENDGASAASKARIFR